MSRITITAESAVKDVVALTEQIAERGCDPQPGQPTEHRSQEIAELEHALITTRVRDLLAEILADIKREQFTPPKNRTTVVSAMERISNLVGRLQADLHEHRDTWSTPQLDPYFLADLESIGEKCDSIIADHYVARSVQNPCCSATHSRPSGKAEARERRSSSWPTRWETAAVLRPSVSRHGPARFGANPCLSSP